MRAPSVNDSDLVQAAQAGDRRALDDLAAAYLPLVYNVVGRALSGHPDMDDIVQDTMLRALRELPTLRTPESFRAWLVTIAIRQVSTHLHRRRVAVWRNTTLDDAIDQPDTDADFEGLTILRLGLSGQRRLAVRASRWLDPDDRALVSLWWLETAGHLSRTELATAMGLTVAHAGVRVQRMTQQLDLSRLIVLALDRQPRCTGLAEVTARWNGRPSPLWRKRIAKHIRACKVCAQPDTDLIPLSRLLLGLGLVPIPLALVAAVTKSILSGGGAVGGVSAVLYGTTNAKLGLLGQLAHAVGTHPIAAVATVGVLASGTVFAMTRADPSPSSPTSAVAGLAVPSAAPTTAGPSAGPPSPSPRKTRPPVTRPPAVTTKRPTPAAPVSVPLGRVSLESVDESGSYVVVVGDRGVLVSAATTSATPTRRAGTFEVVPGLSRPNCYSLRFQDGRYLRHLEWRVRLGLEVPDTNLFKGDATFCARPGLEPNTLRLESANYPGRFLRHVGNELWVDPTDESRAFRASSSFRIRPALAQ